MYEPRKNTKSYKLKMSIQISASNWYNRIKYHNIVVEYSFIKKTFYGYCNWMYIVIKHLLDNVRLYLTES